MMSLNYIALNSEQHILKNFKGMVTAAFEVTLARGIEENQEKYQVRIAGSPAKKTYKSCVEC
jgi:hypothetical protein